MTNPFEHHDLAAEFPEHKDRIHALKQDAHFANLAQKYESVSKEVARIELAGSNTADAFLEAQKKLRAQLKDELFALLQRAA